MADGVRHLKALSDQADAAQRALESGIASADQKWNDEARRKFEAEHLASIRADARRLRVEIAEIGENTERAIRQIEAEGSV